MKWHHLKSKIDYKILEAKQKCKHWQWRFLMDSFAFTVKAFFSRTRAKFSSSFTPKWEVFIRGRGLSAKNKYLVLTIKLLIPNINCQLLFEVLKTVNGKEGVRFTYRVNNISLGCEIYKDNIWCQAVDALKTTWGGKMAIFIWIMFAEKTENTLMLTRLMWKGKQEVLI